MATRRHLLTRGMALAGSVAWSLGQIRGTLAVPSQFDFYVSPNGSDANPGTQSLPWAITSINTRSSQIAGKSVGLMDGIYRMPSTGTPNDGSWIRVAANGTPSQPTVIGAVNPLRATITGNTAGRYPQTPTYLLRVVGSNVRIENLRFFDHSGAGVSICATNTVVDSCSFSDFDFGRIANQRHDNFGAIRTGTGGEPTAVDCVVRNCLIENMKNVGFDGTVQSRGEGIGPCFDVSGITVEYCTIVNVFSALWMKRNAGNYVFRNNLIINAHIAMQEFELADNTRADNDRIYADRPSLMNNNIFTNINSLWGRNGEIGQNWQAAYVYNNTFVFGSQFYGSVHSAFNWYRGEQPIGVEPSRTSKVYNNIFTFNDKAGQSTDPVANFQNGLAGPRGMMLVHDYNAYQSFAMTDVSLNVAYRDIASWRAATGLDTHSIVGNPGLTDVNSANPSSLRLAPGSICKNSGRVDGLPSGAPTDTGAWGGGATKIGSDLQYFRPNGPIVGP